jgi:hypothetical protein
MNHRQFQLSAGHARKQTRRGFYGFERSEWRQTQHRSLSFHPGRKTSDEDWGNPYDPDAKLGKTKHGATDIGYLPERISNLDSGAIVEAEVRLGHAGDSPEVTDRVIGGG